MSMETGDDEDVYSSLNDTSGGASAAKLGPLPSIPLATGGKQPPDTMFYQCEDNVCKLSNGVKLNPFFVRKMRSGGGSSDGSCSRGDSNSRLETQVLLLQLLCNSVAHFFTSF